MKKLIIYGILIYLVFVAPVKKADVGKLQPIETVYLNREGEYITLKTDAGDVGYGKTINEALHNLKETASEIIYLDTAEYLLVAENAKSDINDMRNVLKETVKVCYAEGKIDLQQATKYLSVHGDLPLLKHWNIEDKLPVLSTEKIIEKSQNSS